MIYLDSNVFISAAINNEELGSKCRNLVRRIKEGESKAATSALTFDEVVWKVKKERSFETGLLAGRAILEMKNLSIIEVNETVLAEALGIMKNCILDPRDAIHAACSISRGISTIISEDSDFDRVKELKRKGIMEI